METPHLKEYLANVVPTIMSVKTQDCSVRCNSTQEFEDLMVEIMEELAKRVDNLEDEQVMVMIKEKSPYRKSVKKCLKEKHQPKKILLSIMYSYMEFLITHSKFTQIINFKVE